MVGIDLQPSTTNETISAIVATCTVTARFWLSEMRLSFNDMDPATVIAQARQKLEDVDRRIVELEGFLKRMEEKEADPYRQMIVEYGIRYQRMRREWLEDLRARATAQTHEKPSRLAAGAP